ncbi:acetyl-CoA carboxyl transferase [Streptomyces sp. NBC_01239]|uniref:carboxyl transferase domain-containing protein n=1 Tax=Streptomyces sp. NBC_01239 TaxID=2903792 RepID=UPI00225697E4|nr:carboxyl transferase domain-containing protein [Streptomyces sp. NBC_01239]MCX4817988.1 acetyl-CoA carboxyl transferase [Streptomyces sp. NBC_01239]
MSSSAGRTASGSAADGEVTDRVPAPVDPAGRARTTTHPVTGLVQEVADPGSWEPWDDAPSAPAAGESIITGCVRIGGRRAALVVSDFSHLGGSVGVTAAGRLASAIDRATWQRLPLVAMPASGGTRMQDGTLAFLRMIDITRLLAEHRAAGLPYLVYLRNPTTGGVLASWASLGQLTFAEPGALVGFLGPRVHEILAPGALPRDTQRAENLADRGVVDGVVARAELRGVLASVLSVLAPLEHANKRAARHPVRRPDGIGSVEDGERAGSGTMAGGRAWDAVRRTRDSARPGARELLATVSRRTVHLSGTQGGERDAGTLLALADIAGQPCVVVGHDRSTRRPTGPAGLRTARRGIRLAAELRLPLLSIVDTAGAELSSAAEEGALAGEIARTLTDLVSLSTPTVSVLLGEGAGGTALALLPADRTVAAGNAWLAPLPPEGASALVHRDITHAEAMADAQHITSADLLKAGAVDRVVDEPPDVPDDPTVFLRRLGDAIVSELDRVTSSDPAKRLTARHSRYAHLGS